MPDIKYQKIELHSTYDLVKDQDIIEQEREAAQKLMEDNQIQFAMEIDQKEIKSPTGRHTNVVYVLNLIVKEDEVDKVIELLDKDGNFGYYVDLDSTYDQNEEIKSEQDDNEIEIPEELKDVIEETKDDPIKMYGYENEEDENLEDYKIKVKPIDGNAFPRFMIKFFISLAYTIILIPELLGIIYGIQETEYEIATAMFVLVVVETPIFLSFYNALNKKNK